MSGPMTEADFANLSDDDIMNMAVPPEVTAAPEAPQQEEVQHAVEEAPASVEPPIDAPAADPTPAEAPGSAAGDEPAQPNPAAADLPDEAYAGDTPPAAAPGGADASKAEAPVPGKDDARPAEAGKVDADPAKPAAAEQPVDYKAQYEKLMAPFKANGKLFTPQSPEELVQLAQMGANYTKKMQAMQPGIRVLQMLEKHDLLDEGKLSFLIDLDKKDPKAIQKFIRDSGIDPMDLDTSVDPGYQPTDHRVPEAEVNFKSALEETLVSDTGKELVVDIDKTWDDRSKQALWADPSILKILNEQKQTGIYAKITSELDRRKVLGHYGNVSFLEAYMAVGRELDEKGLLVQAPSPATAQAAPVPSAVPAPQPPASQVIATQVAPSAKTVTNDDKARAALSTKTGVKKVDPNFNPLGMSDEEFEKINELGQRL